MTWRQHRLDFEYCKCYTTRTCLTDSTEWPLVLTPPKTRSAALPGAPEEDKQTMLRFLEMHGGTCA